MKLSRPQEYSVTSTQDINLFLAGVGSGKTHIIGVASGYLVDSFPRVFGFIGANTYQQLSTSTMFRVREVWKEVYGWEEGVDYVSDKQPPKHYNTEWHNFEKYNGIISFRNGGVIFKGSLDNAKAHDGKEFCWAYLDETKNTREFDVKETIMTRLRQPGIYVDAQGQLRAFPVDDDNKVLPMPSSALKQFNPLYICTSPARVSWINEWFGLDDRQHEIQAKIYDHEEFYVAEFDDKCIVISSTYHNVENVGQNYIDKILGNTDEEGGKRLIYGNPFVRSGGEFYSGFNRMVHVTEEAEYRDNLPLHISFDQNVVPYITMTIYQVDEIDDVTWVYQVDELCLENPRNKTGRLCLEFIRLWGAKAKEGLFYYGDPSGRKRDTRGLEHDYQIVQRVLRKYLNNRSDRVPYKHPPIVKRRDFANNMFEGLYDVRVRVHPRCKKSIADFEFVKEDTNGKKLKEKAKGDDGRSYEKYGHTSDSYDYFICELFKRLFAREFD